MKYRRNQNVGLFDKENTLQELLENGKIAEHWDVMETIAPESDWKHQNGKFNF